MTQTNKNTTVFTGTSLDSTEAKIIIDKLSFTFHQDDSLRVMRTCQQLRQQIDDGQVIGFYGPSDRYRWRFRVIMTSTHGDQTPLIIEAIPRFPSAASYRVDMNPSKLGPAGVASALQFLERFTDSTSEQLFRASRITRIDIALDLQDTSLADVIVWRAKHRRFGIFTDQGGDPESQYFGSQRGNRSAVYNKRVGTEQVLRIEQRVKPNLFGADLSYMSNPFSGFYIVKTGDLISAMANTSLKKINANTFIDSARLRGFTRAASFLENRQQSDLRMIIKNETLSSIPSPETIWQKWPSVLAESGFGFLISDDWSDRQLELRLSKIFRTKT